MPRKTEWLLRVPEILEDLAALPCPVLDRATLERLFRLGRRRSIDLMASFGAYQAGRTYLIERTALIARLREIAGSESYSYERRRKERLSAALEKVRRYQRAARVHIQPAAPSQPDGPMLGEGVLLERGRLCVEFASMDDLLTKLRTIALAAAEDFETFERTVSAAIPPADPRV